MKWFAEKYLQNFEAGTLKDTLKVFWEILRRFQKNVCRNFAGPFQKYSNFTRKCKVMLEKFGETFIEITEC